jgi:hypothetical protein
LLDKRSVDGWEKGTFIEIDVAPLTSDQLISFFLSDKQDIMLLECMIHCGFVSVDVLFLIRKFQSTSFRLSL